MPLDLEATKAALRELCQITVPVTDDDAGRIGLFLIVAVQDLLDELAAARAEVARLREAIQQHRADVYGEMDPIDLCDADYEEDLRLYAALEVKD